MSAPAPRRLALGPGAAATATLVLAVGIWLATNVGWYVEHRAGAPRNIDELGYFSIALDDAFGLRDGGPLGWLARLSAPTIQAPLTTAVTSLLLPLTGDAFETGIAIVLLSGAATIVMLFVLLRRLVSPWTLLLVVTCMATTPLFVQMSRQFAFAVPLCATLLGALLALMRSDMLRRTGPAVVFGLLLGCIPLTRTMGAGFVPSFALVAVVLALAGRADRGRRVRNLLVAGSVSAVVAVPWYAANWTHITDYLTQYAYGDQADAYAGGSSSWLVDAAWPFLSSMLLLHLLVIVGGWACAAVVLVRRLRGGRYVPGEAAWTAAAAATITLGGLAALATTSNDGTGFGLPLVAPALVVVALGVDRLLANRRRVRVVVSSGLAACLVVASSGYFGVASVLTEERTVSLAGGGYLTVTDGTDDDQAYPFDSGIVGGDPEDAAAWQTLTDELVDTVVARTPTSIAFGFRGAFLNVNGFQVGAMQRLGYPVAVAQIDPLTMDGEADYLAWLESGAAAGACVLATSPGSTNEFPPIVDPVAIEEAAVDAGFVPFELLTSPDERTITLWSRDLPGCPTYLDAQMLP